MYAYQKSVGVVHHIFLRVHLNSIMLRNVVQRNKYVPEPEVNICHIVHIFGMKIGLAQNVARAIAVITILL